MLTTLKTKLKGWRTIIMNALFGIPAGVLVALDQFAAVDISPLLPASYAAKIIAGMSVLGIILRWATTGPVGSKA